MDADQPVVLSPSLGRRWWMLMAVVTAGYVIAGVVAAVRSGLWWVALLAPVSVLVCGAIIGSTRRRMRVVLGDEELTRRSGRIRLGAREIADVTTAPGVMMRRAVVVTTRAGDLVPLGLEGPDPHHAVETARTIRQWAERHGADLSSAGLSSAAVVPRALPDGTVLRAVGRPMAVVSGVVVAPWSAVAIRSFSAHPPLWVLVCGALGTLPALWVLRRIPALTLRVEGDHLVVGRLSGVVRIAARDVAGVDLDTQQHVRVLRSNAAPVTLALRAGIVPGLPGRLMAWAQEHGGGVGQPLTGTRSIDWTWMLCTLVVVALLLTPLYWALTPHDMARGYISLGSIMAVWIVGTLIADRRRAD